MNIVSLGHKMDSLYIGIDNGVTGSIAALSSSGRVAAYFETPVILHANYTKTKAHIHRVDVPTLLEKLGLLLGHEWDRILCSIERPMVNPGRFKATVSALRCLEATLIVIEKLAIPYQYLDSKEWQKIMLPKGLEKEELKFASDEVCKRLFPEIHLSKSGKGDSLLIAEYMRRKNNG